jgi:hypothetical protein
MRYSNLKKHLSLDISSTNDTFVPSLHCLSLSSCKLESTLPPAAQLLLSQSQHGDLVGHHLRCSNVFERISRSSCETLYATKTSHRTQEIFRYEYLLPFTHKKKNTRKRCSSVVQPRSTVAILKTETSLRICACASIWTVMKLQWAAT